MLHLPLMKPEPALKTSICLALLICASGTSGAKSKLPDATQVSRFAEQLLHDTYPADGPGAAVLVNRDGEVLFRGARGMASLELGVPLSADQSFRIGSITKQFAAATLLKLVDAGKLELDDPLSKFLPKYPGGDKITVRQLLDHTSGVKSYTDLPEVMGGTIRNDLSTEALVATFKDLPVNFAPGEQWAYNNSGYVLVGAVIEVISGKPWFVQLHDSLLVPSGLKHTVYGANDRLIPQMASGYTVRDGGWAPMAFLSMTQPHAAGALVSTVDDLHGWNLALHGGKLLDPPTHTAMTTPAGKALAAGYGFGIGRGSLRGHVKYEHGGGIFGFSSFLMYVPDQRLSVVVLQNADSTLNGKGEPQRLAVLLGAFALGDPYPETKPITVSQEVLQEAEGVYRIDPDNTRVLRVVDGKLTAQRTGGERLNLLPIEVDRFAYEGSLTWLKLERDAAGKPSGIRIFHEGEGEGELTPRSTEALPAERASVNLQPTQLERLVGNYNAGAMRMKVYVEDGQLKSVLDGQPSVDLFAESPNLFFLTVVDATLEFTPETGTADSLTLRQGEAVIQFKRED